MKNAILILTFCLVASFSRAASVAVLNQTLIGDGAYGLFDSSGALIPGATDSNLRVGYFTLTDEEITSAFAVGNLTLLNDHFIQFGENFGMQDYGAEADGVFEGAPNVGSSDSFVGQFITLWAVDSSSNFLNTSAEHLIYRFDEQYQIEPWIGGQVLLGTSSGSLLVGGYNNFSHDYGLGSGPLPGFNTIAVVPEPGTLGLGITGLAIVAAIASRRRLVI